MSNLKTNRCAVMAHVPPDLRKKLDAAAKKARRTRSAEIQVRLEESLKSFASVPAATPTTGARGA